MTDDVPGGGLPVPGWLVERARAFAESGATPVPARLAATVIVLRPAEAGFEIYAVRRAATMAFAAGMYAFPGGSVDPSDSDAYIGWTGPGPADWARRLDLPVGPAQAVVCAAVRELFEEAGVLLAGRAADHILGGDADPDDAGLDEDLSGPEWEAARADLLARRRSLTGWFGQAGLTLRADLLVPWARWLTPEFESRRFDTFFFLALLPERQSARDVGGEADHTIWTTPRAALGLPMLPPTLHTLRELSQYADIPALLDASAGRDVSVPVQPVLEVSGGRAYMKVAPREGG